jgi:glutathione synthase/RimK-type ligase-like ATP-grasp enzyme
MKKLIIVNAFNTTQHFAEKVEEYFNNRFGEAEVVDMERIYGTIPKHDVILVRCGFPKDGYYYESLARHERSHGCSPVNSAKCISSAYDKYEATQIAQTVMRVPKAGRIGFYEMEERYLREKVAKNVPFPAFLKPRYSSGGKNVHSYSTPERFIEAKDYEKVERWQGGNWMLQEAIPFNKLIRAVWIDGEGLVDAVYDVPDAGKKYYIHDKLGDNCRIYPDRNWDALETTVEKLAKKFDSKHFVVDLFEKDDEFIFNEVNNATNLWWLNRISGVKHALLLAQLMNRI